LKYADIYSRRRLCSSTWLF